jgi:hypothetical protein
MVLSFYFSGVQPGRDKCLGAFSTIVGGPVDLEIDCFYASDKGHLCGKGSKVPLLPHPPETRA